MAVGARRRQRPALGQARRRAPVGVHEPSGPSARPSSIASPAAGAPSAPVTATQVARPRAVAADQPRTRRPPSRPR